MYVSCFCEHLSDTLMCACLLVHQHLKVEGVIINDVDMSRFTGQLRPCFLFCFFYLLIQQPKIVIMFGQLLYFVKTVEP